MELPYDDRPISMYDNLNVTAAVTAPSAQKPRQQQHPLGVAATPMAGQKTNGAVHTTPLANITFNFNDNNNAKAEPHVKPQLQLQLNGNRNLNHTPAPNSNDLYATPFKMVNTPILSRPITAANTSAAAAPSTAAAAQAAPAAGLGSTLTSSSPLPSSSTSPARPLTASPAAAAIGHTERPLSQHSQSELNETASNSIAAVKAALNEAKSKFFGLNGYTPAQQRQACDPHESLRQHLLSNAVQPQMLQQTAPKPQPKYQNIPENSAIFRNQVPELPPKPLEYQNLGQHSAKPSALPSASRTASPSGSRHMEHQSPLQPDSGRKFAPGTTYNQIPLNDIDSPPRSQSVYMATTVPQNMKGNKIAGRHTPTRSSLRHSRMLVVTNKHYEEVQHPNPMGFRQPNLARWLLILQIIVGILLLGLSIWIFMLAPNTAIQENPYWCGLALILAGIIGLVLIRYKRLKRAKTREHCFKFLRMDSYVLALLSLVLCCAALTFAAIHYCRLTAQDTKCESGNMFNEHASCVCVFHALDANGNQTLGMNASALYAAANDGRMDTDASYKFEYRDLSCTEVRGPWVTILSTNFVISSVGFLICLAYLVLLSCCRSSEKRSYTTVRTSTF